MPGVEPRAINPVQPTPEDLFLAWLMRLPYGADISQAARLEIARLDRVKAFCEITHRYRIMLELAGSSPPHLHQGRRRVQH
jgi:hypothetical protein